MSNWQNKNIEIAGLPDHRMKITWMAVWCADNGLKLELEGECGFGRECVGVSIEGKYPDYGGDGKVWAPEDAYHKHPCVAVLGRGEVAESQLYEWLRWFDSHGFKLETGNQEYDRSLGEIAILLGQHRYARMVKKDAINQQPQNQRTSE